MQKALGNLRYNSHAARQNMAVNRYNTQGQSGISVSKQKKAGSVSKQASFGYKMRVNHPVAKYAGLGGGLMLMGHFKSAAAGRSSLKPSHIATSVGIGAAAGATYGHFSSTRGSVNRERALYHKYGGKKAKKVRYK